MQPDLQLALWSLNRLSSEAIVETALAWLSAGKDSPTLREIAGTERPQMSDVGPLFWKAIAELGFTTPARSEALLIVAKDYARRILDGAISPYEGATGIWWDVANEIEAPSQLLLSFVGAASELDDLPERSLQDGYDRRQYARELNEQIVESARMIIDQKEPNQALQATSVTPAICGKVSDSDRTQRGA